MEKRYLRILIEPTEENDGRWDAHCLEFDLVATRHEIKDAVASVLAQCDTTWAEDQANDIDSFKCRRLLICKESWAKAARIIADGPNELDGQSQVAIVQVWLYGDLKVGPIKWFPRSAGESP